MPTISGDQPTVQVDSHEAVIVGCDPGPFGDGALRFAAIDARVRGVGLIVMAMYGHHVDSNLDDYGPIREASPRGGA